MPRDGAAVACRPGHLVDITSMEEQDFVVKLLTEAEVKDAWFGLLKTNTLIWSDGSSVVRESWQDIRTGGGRQCFRLDQSKGYSWNDKSCDEKYYFVCEYEGRSR